MVRHLRAQGLGEGDDHPPIRSLVEHGELTVTAVRTDGLGGTRPVAHTCADDRIVRMKVDGFPLDGPVLLVERLEDEDDGDQHRKTLLGEARDVADQRAQVERHHYQQHQ